MIRISLLIVARANQAKLKVKINKSSILITTLLCLEIAPMASSGERSIEKIITHIAKLVAVKAVKNMKIPRIVNKGTNGTVVIPFPMAKHNNKIMLLRKMVGKMLCCCFVYMIFFIKRL